MSDNKQHSTSVVIADPMTAFLEAHCKDVSANRAGKRFNSGEHMWLGGHGAARACEELQRTRGLRIDPKIFAAIRRAQGRDELQYGELVALSGDFYESPVALFEERPSPLPWLWESNDLSDLRDMFLEELRWIDARGPGARQSPYPEKNIRMAWNAKAYVELALGNTTHFGWHNVCAYVRHHGEALRLAASCHGRQDETFRRALYTNAFADHFLTDGFAAGHIRVPRAEIRTWAESRGLSEKIAGALSKLLHDQDGHVDLQSFHGSPGEDQRALSDGLRVEDSTGAIWTTYCDGQLFLYTGGPGATIAAERAVTAVAESVCELLLAWQLGEMPRGVYAATKRVPFPHSGTPPLTEKFAADIPDEVIERLWKSVGWYAKVPWISGLDRQHIRDLFRALPEIMRSFRANIAADLAASGEFGTRIAPGYVSAYKRIA